MEESRQDQTDIYMVALFTRVDVGVLFSYLSEPGFSNQEINGMNHGECHARIRPMAFPGIKGLWFIPDIYFASHCFGDEGLSVFFEEIDF